MFHLKPLCIRMMDHLLSQFFITDLRDFPAFFTDKNLAVVPATGMRTAGVSVQTFNSMKKPMSRPEIQRSINNGRHRPFFVGGNGLQHIVRLNRSALLNHLSKNRSTTGSKSNAPFFTIGFGLSNKGLNF